MSSRFDKLCQEQIINDAPSHMKNNVHYECIMGSVAYGVSDDNSDMDIYGFCMPPKHILFPYDYGHLVNFGDKPENFLQYQKHHIKDFKHNKEYDFSIYNIVRFFQLVMENNPNMVDALFVPTRCVLHSTAIGQHVRDKRKMFLSKRVWHTFKGYAFSQMHKMKNKFAKEWVDLCKKNQWDIMITREEIDEHYSSDDQAKAYFLLNKIENKGKRSKRLPLIEIHGYDTKFGYHVVRLADECQQLLETGDMDLTQSREHLKAIRRGEWSLSMIEKYFDNKLLHLEEMYSKSELPYAPDEGAIKELLMECIEMHYGSVDKSGLSDPMDFDVMGFRQVVNDLNVASNTLNRIFTKS